MPDNVLTPLIKGVTSGNYFLSVGATREDEAIGTVTGAYIARRQPQRGTRDLAQNPLPKLGGITLCHGWGRSARVSQHNCRRRAGKLQQSRNSQPPHIKRETARCVVIALFKSSNISRSRRISDPPHPLGASSKRSRCLASTRRKNLDLGQTASPRLMWRLARRRISSRWARSSAAANARRT